MNLRPYNNNIWVLAHSTVYFTVGIAPYGILVVLKSERAERAERARAGKPTEGQRADRGHAASATDDPPPAAG
jgi:hypothetical protein